MVREITGIRVEHKSPNAKAKQKVPTDTGSQVDPKSLDGKNEVVKECEVKECTSDVTRGDTSLETQDVLSESTNFDAEKPEIKSGKTNDQNANLPFKPSSETTAVGSTRKKSTPQKISDVTVDKQVCESPIATETPSNSKSPNSCKKSLPNTPSVTKNYIEEDRCSMASSAVSGKTARSRVTTGVAPTFASDERVQKRKEYYAKLEEKRKALEAERREYEARTKEEEEAAMKKLRKTMTYKANPVPSFYYEKPPPRKELKKLPTTRAVSPKFGRRKSCSDAVTRSSDEKVSGQTRSTRYSLGNQTTQSEHSAPRSSLKKKERDQSKASSMDTIKRSPNTSEKTNVDVAVQS